MAPRPTHVLPKHEVVVITGGSAGVGRAVAQRVAREGAWIGLLARDPARLEDTKREIESLGGKAVIHAGDVAEPAAHEALAELVEQTFGPIDVWINNAMTSVYSRIHELPPEEFQRVTDVTYLGVVYGTQAALRRMRPRDHGTIVQVGSALAYRSIPFQSAYCAAKHAVRGFTDSLRAELKHDGLNIGLTMVQLPAVNPPQFTWAPSRLPPAAKPPAPVFQPEVAAEAIWWAAHHRRREVYVRYKTSLGIRLNRLASALFDRFPGQRSFGETQRPRDPRPPDNLWRPAKGLYAARGPYDTDAHSGSLHLTVSKHRSAWLWALVGMAGAVAFAWRRKEPSRGPAWNRR